MTGEIHGMVVRAAIKALRSLSQEDQDKFLRGIPFPKKSVAWVYKHPTLRTKLEDRAMKLIEKATHSREFMKRIKDLK
jgi:hypothetical protein